MKSAYTLMLVGILYYVVTIIFTVCMPQVSNDLNVSYAEVKATMSWYQLGTVLSTICTAIYADRLGKKNAVYLGLILAIIGTIIVLLSYSLGMISIGRFIQGLGATIGFIVTFGIIVDLFEQKTLVSILGLYGMLISLLLAISPIIGGYITYYTQWRIIFMILLFIYILTVILAYYQIPSKVNESRLKGKNNLDDYLTIISNRTIQSYVWLNSIFLAGYWFTMSYLPYYFQVQLNIEITAYGIFAGLITLGFTTGTLVSKSIVARIGVDNTINLGIWIGGIGSFFVIPIALYLNTSIAFIIIALYLFNIGNGIAYPPTAIVFMGVFKEHTTLISSFRTFTVTLMAFIGSTAAVFADDSHLFHLSYFLLAASIAIIVIYNLRDKSVKY